MTRHLPNPLHPQAAKQLESYLDELITNPTFEFECMEEDGSDMETIFVFHEPPIEKIEKLIPHRVYVDGDVIQSVCSSVLKYLFREKDIIRKKNPNFYDDGDGTIFETKDYVDKKFVITARQILLDYLYNNVSFEYNVFALLPWVFLPDNEPFVISEEIKMVQIKLDLNNKNFPRLFAEHHEYTSEPWNKDKDGDTYVAIKLYGPGINSQVTVFRKALGTLKILTAALYAMGVLACRDYPGSRLDPSDSFFIYPLEEHRKPPFLPQEPVMSVIMAEIESDFINRLHLNRSCLEPNQLELAAIESGKKKDSPSEKHKRLQQKLSPVRKLFTFTSEIDKMVEINRVRNALHWYFDGIADFNASFSFIKLTIAIETLLGEPNAKKDIVQRLADRCSFLIATDAIERKKIKKDFIAAYDVRSKIIHEGKAQLDKNDTIHHINMEKFLREALFREIDSLPNA